MRSISNVKQRFNEYSFNAHGMVKNKKLCMKKNKACYLKVAVRDKREHSENKEVID